MKKSNKRTKATNQKEGRFLNGYRKLTYTLSMIITSLVLTTPVYASGTTTYLEPINKLKTVAISIVAAAGVIVLIYGGVKFAESFQKKDQNGEYAAIYTIIAGAVMVGISAIITALT